MYFDLGVGCKKSYIKYIKNKILSNTTYCYKFPVVIFLSFSSQKITSTCLKIDESWVNMRDKGGNKHNKVVYSDITNIL